MAPPQTCIRYITLLIISPSDSVFLQELGSCFPRCFIAPSFCLICPSKCFSPVARWEFIVRLSWMLYPNILVYFSAFILLVSPFSPMVSKNGGEPLVLTLFWGTMISTILVLVSFMVNLFSDRKLFMVFKVSLNLIWFSSLLFDAVTTVRSSTKLGTMPHFLQLTGNRLSCTSKLVSSSQFSVSSNIAGISFM